MFLLKYYNGWSLVETYNMPIGLRRWMLRRLIKLKKEEAEENKKANTSR